MTTYEDFLRSKVELDSYGGFDADISHEWLKPFQREIVRIALSNGRFGIFADTGLGKTRMQIAIADACVKQTGKPALIVCPLAVASQTILEAFSVCGIDIQRHGSGGMIEIINYDRISEVDPARFGTVLLDESSILKNFSGATKKLLCEMFAETQYRFCFTATPSPNDHMELGNHSQFLGVMDSTEMIMRFFSNDQSKAGAYYIKPHAEDRFWAWVASWSIVARKPSDVGDFSDDGYILPPLHVHRHIVQVEPEQTDALISDVKLSATTLHKEMRRTVVDRAAALAEVVNDNLTDPWIIWCETNYEVEEVLRVIADAVNVEGSMKDSEKERLLLGFARGEFRILLTKPSIAGMGLNYQHCAHMAFVGGSYSYERMYQSIRRCWRFGQSRPVHVWAISADTEWSILETVEAKQKHHEEMVTQMVESVRKGAESKLVLRFDESSESCEGENWKLMLGDCQARVKEIKADSVGLTVFSPPFSNLYTYSDAVQDMGNCADDDEFFAQFGFFVPEMLRITQPGRLVVIHCKDLPKYLNKHGAVGLRDFPGAIVKSMEAGGFTFHSRVTVWKCPVTERERTNNNGLLHKTVRRDRTQLRMGMADFVLAFRKPPTEGNTADSPVGTDDGFVEYVGDPSEDPRLSNAHPSRFARNLSNRPSIDIWRRYAEPVWWDIDQMDVLNIKQARDPKDEKHICPLQLGLIRRVVDLWSNPGDLVFSPFTGLGSEGYVALQEGRRFVGTELKDSYYRVAAQNLATAQERKQLDLFSLEGVGA